MRTGLLAAAVAALLAPPLAAADPPVVYQSQPVGRLIDDTRAMARLLGGEKAVAEVNKFIGKQLGPKGFDGLDLSRPVVGYLYVTPDVKEMAEVLALPVTGEKEFLDLVERFLSGKPKAGKDGVYELPPLGMDLHCAVRVANGYAYVASAFKDPAAVLDPKALIPVEKLYDPTDTALATVRVDFDRFPKELRDQMWAALDAGRKASSPAALPKSAPPEVRQAVERWAKLAERYTGLAKDAKAAALRVRLDAATADLSAELTVTPAPGSPLAALFAGVKPTTNKFAGLYTPDMAAGFRFSLPLFDPDVRALAADGLEILRKEAANAPPPIKGLFDELVNGAIRTVKAGDVDLAVVVYGPAKDGTFTNVAALAFDDPSGVEKELKKLSDTFAPDEAKKMLKWGAAKENGVEIHTIDMSGIPDQPGQTMRGLFGQNVTFAFAFAPKAVYAAVGPDAVGAVKAAMAVKPGASQLLESVVNPARAAKMAAAVRPGGAVPIEYMIGKDDQPISAGSLAVAGGKDLKLTVGWNLKLITGVVQDALPKEKEKKPLPAPPPVFEKK